MGLRDSRCVLGRRSGLGLFSLVGVLCFTTLFSPVFALGDADVANLSDPVCDVEIAAHDPQIIEDTVAVLADVREACPSQTACSDKQLAKAFDGAVKAKGGKSRSLLRRVLLIPRRGLVLLLWGTSILGPGLLSYYVGMRYGLSDGLRITMSSFIMTITGILFGRFSSPVDKRLSPNVEKLAYILWDPGEGDGWGQIQKSINEAERLRNSQVYNQLLFLRAYFKEAGHATKRDNYKAAARHYSNAILNSCDMFAGLHLTVPATIREVRTYLPNIEDLSVEAKKQIIFESVARINELKADEIPKDWTKAQLIKFAVPVLMHWFQLENG